MKTLTITEAKKNLGKWLTAAVKGQDVGIISGAAIIALRPIEVRPADLTPHIPIDYAYLLSEYGLTKEDAEAFERKAEARLEKDIHSGKPLTIEDPTLEKLEKIVAAYRRAARATRKPEKVRAGRRLARAA